MKILFITLEVFGPSKKGGGERYVSELARATQDHGLDIQIVAVRSPLRLAEVSIDADSHKESPIGISRLAQMVAHADVVHVHQLNTSAFDYGAFLCAIYRKPLVLTDHGGGTLTPSRLFGRHRLRFVTAAAYVSNWSRQDTDPKAIVKLHSVVLGGGDHLPEAPALPRRYNFGFVGRLLPHKGAHVIIEALPLGSSLVVAGQARDPEYMAKISMLAKGKDVVFIQDASDEIVASLHRSIDYLLVPSVTEYGAIHYTRPELLGLVALEALAAGTPVIGSDVGGLGEVLRAASQHTVPPNDVNAWNKAMILALTATPPTVFKDDFTWNTVAEKCIDLYKSVSRQNGR